MGRVYRIIFRRNTPNRGVLFAEGAFVRKNYEASGCLYIPEEMKDVLTEEELAKIFQKRAAECRNFTVIRYPGYTSTPILFAGGMGVHIPYRVDNRELGFLHVPEEMMKILTAEELTKNVKAIVNQENNFLLYRGDGSPCPPKTKLTDAGDLDNLVINNEEVDEKNNVEKETLKKLPDETAEDQDRDKEDSDGKTADQQRDEVLNEGQEEEALLPMEKSDQESYA